MDPESVVRMKTGAAVAAPAPLIMIVEPALKPYQPIHRMKVPRACSTVLWPGISIGGGSGGPPQVGRRNLLYGGVNRPGRGPMTAAPTKLAMPPVKCTAPDPAKSRAPPLKAFGFRVESQP